MAFNLAQYLAQSASGVGVLGAVVGASAAAAKNIKDHRDGLVDTKDAIYDTSKEGLGAGVATALSAVAAGAVGGGLAVSLGTALVAATGAKYVWDRGVEQVELSMRDKDEVDEILAEGVEA